MTKNRQKTPLKARVFAISSKIGTAFLCFVVFECCAFSVVAQEAELRIPNHLEFISQWFPRAANSATHTKVARATRLATIVSNSPSQFRATKQTLALIREHVGIDPAQVEEYTSATITVGVPGTIVFFTLVEQLNLEDHFSTGKFPLTPEVHRFHNHRVYRLPAKGRPLGLYTAEGKHFVLGDWDAFKNTMRGNAGRLNELAKILAGHVAPLIICSNPRRAGKRFSKDDPFGTVISIDFEADKLAFLMREEHPTPAIASSRHAEIETAMPAAFIEAYGMETKKMVQYRSLADGRQVTFAVQSPIVVASRMLEYILGATEDTDARAEALATADQAIKKFEAARAAKASLGALQSPEAIVDALCVGIEAGGVRFQLPFLTGVEQARVATQLRFGSGKLVLRPEAEDIVRGQSLEEREIRRQAQRIAALTMSAAAAESPGLRKLTTPEEIVAAICSTGFLGGGSYKTESFKVDRLSEEDRVRVAGYLARHHGYLVYKPE
ncbi:MAG: hypothetical protein ACI9UA_002097 [Pseudoalteromonas tetraodonis]